MSVITNRLGLPAPVVQAVERWAAKYQRGTADYTATQLIKPPLMLRLQAKYKEKITEDVLDRLYALQGQVVHKILEEGAQDDQLTEIRLEADFGGVRVSGQADIYIPDEGLLQDYKTCSVYAVMGSKPEWEAQLNILAELVRRNGGEVKQLEIVALFRDWSAGKAKRGGDYPPEKAAIVPIELWPPERATAYITERVSLHEAARTADWPEDISECTPDERWERPGKWAVMKKGRKMAVKLHDSREAAEQHALDMMEKTSIEHYVEERPGERVRCASYCNVAQWCPYYKKED